MGVSPKARSVPNPLFVAGTVPWARERLARRIVSAAGHPLGK